MKMLMVLDLKKWDDLKIILLHNDYVGITIENGSEVVYWRKAHNGSVWKRINIKNSALRFNPSTGDTLHFCYSVYGANGFYIKCRCFYEKYIRFSC